MKIYLVYKFKDYAFLENQIMKLESECGPADQIFYFVKNADTEWQKKAKQKIDACDGVVYLRVSNEAYRPEEMDNIGFELQYAEEINRPIRIVELAGSPEQQMAAGDQPSPDWMYRCDFNGQTIAKYRKLDSLSIDAIKRSFFNMEKTLFNGPESEDRTRTLLEEYHIMLETSEKMMDRRQGTNSFYITLCSAMLAVMVSLIATKIDTVVWCVMIIVMSLLMEYLCHNWKETLVAYGLSNQAKYEVLNAIEAQLPASIFQSEWKYGKTLRYESYSERETKIPKAFMVLFGLLILASIVILIWFRDAIHIAG